MATHVAFLRGMNLGNRRIANDDLRAAFERIGFGAVATFRASGNVAFDSDGEQREGAIVERIETGLRRELGYEVPTFLRTCAEVRQIAAREPFDEAALAASKGKQQVLMLLAKPSAAASRKALALASEDDRLAVEGRELHWLPRGGMSDSELDLKAVEAELGPTTCRTMGTVGQIAAKHCG